jgi:putative ABC transport system permease protein
MTPWQRVKGEDAVMASQEEETFLVGGILLAVLSVASVATLMSGRMAEEERRAAILKEAGASPRVVGSVFLAENGLLALVGAVVGIVVGRVVAPVIANAGAALVGSPGLSPEGPASVTVVLLAVVGVALIPTAVPAWRAAHRRTVEGFTSGVAHPRRLPSAVRLTRHLPVPLLFGLRLAARRPQRVVLNSVSVATTVAMMSAVLGYQRLSRLPVGHTVANPVTGEVGHVAFLLSLILVVLAGINAVFISWTTVMEMRRASAILRALGASAHQLLGGLACAQLVSCLVGAIIGVLAGVGLLAAVGNVAVPKAFPGWQWVALLFVASLAVLSGLTIVGARLTGNLPVATVLQEE